jgi:hypothetical protein
MSGEADRLSRSGSSGVGRGTVCRPPRNRGIRLGRLFDQRSYRYLGYALQGVRTWKEARESSLPWNGADTKHPFPAGATVSREALPAADPRLETMEFYKIRDLRSHCTWGSARDPLSVHRERVTGHSPREPGRSA